jgi:cell division protein FtsB
VIEYTELNKVTEKLFKESEHLRKEIESKEESIEKLQEQKGELIKLNLVVLFLFRSSPNKSMS